MLYIVFARFQGRGLKGVNEFFEIFNNGSRKVTGLINEKYQNIKNNIKILLFIVVKSICWHKEDQTKP